MAMEKAYQPQEFEEKIYQFWEKGGYFTPKIISGRKPFTVLLPLPNANDPLHMGHGLFVIEDILARYHRMLGDPTLWLPGADHAGIETQYVFEKKLGREGKSRFNFDRKTLYQMIFDFVEQNRDTNRQQLKKLGFSLDWTRYHYSLEPEIIKTVLNTFGKLHKDGLIYRGERIVNFCTHCGTAFSDLEVDYVEKNEFLYYLNYGPISIATTRPETIFADVAVAINPKDRRYKKLVGQKAMIPLINKEIPIITDQLIDINFGTGALKVTPAHDATDFEIGQKNKLETITVIDKNGKMANLPEKYLGMTVNRAREETIKDLKTQGKLIKVEPLKHAIGICYRCKTTIEPMIMPQWFVKIKPLAKPAIEEVRKGRTKIVPKKRFEKMYFDWMENIHDWNISRQIVWGPQIPVWYCLDCNPDILINFLDEGCNKISGPYQELKGKCSFAEIKDGLQSLSAGKNPIYSLDDKPCQKCQGKNILQETDTFDTWFLSGQWPLTTLGYPDGNDFKYFYPTSVLDTLWDILFFWVARMMMFGFYLTGKAPFKVIHLHCRVVDEKGQKMSKSKENVIDPMETVDKYGADALRMALVFGAAPGSDIHIGDDKLRAMRNFANKLWNIGRFILMNLESVASEVPFYDSKMTGLTKEDQEILKDLDVLIKKVTSLIECYRFDLAAESLYQFTWHRFADEYLEYSKDRIKEGNRVVLSVLRYVYLDLLKLLHPFMPFIAEEIWQKFPRRDKEPLIISPWPK
jgi:valyl-tRNA synthetase